jgi:hypothetical protein
MSYEGVHIINDDYSILLGIILVLIFGFINGNLFGFLLSALPYHDLKKEITKAKYFFYSTVFGFGIGSAINSAYMFFADQIFINNNFQNPPFIYNFGPTIRFLAFFLPYCIFSAKALVRMRNESEVLDPDDELLAFEQV